jgi:hypothetical protein
MSDSGLASPVGYTSSGMQHVQIAQYGNDTGMHAEFYSEPVYQEFESKGGELITGTIKSPDTKIVAGKGRPIYKEKVFIHITRPGAKSDLRREVPMAFNLDGTPALDDQGRQIPQSGDGSYPSFPERFPKQWQQFLNKQEQTHSGTPLEMWAPLTKSQVLELKGAKIHTVEQLGTLPDSVLQNLGMMDARVLRDKAKAFMESAEGGAALNQALSMIEQLKVDNEAMKQQFKLLSAERTEKKPAKTKETE